MKKLDGIRKLKCFLRLIVDINGVQIIKLFSIPSVGKTIL